MARGRARATEPADARHIDNGLGREIERKLWAAANKLRGSIDAAEYKHVVLGLIFLQRSSDAFEGQREMRLAKRDQGADPDDPDEYWSANVFWVPAEARWPRLFDRAKQPSIGSDVAKSMDAIERKNSKLKGVLPKDYNRPGLDMTQLGVLIDQIGSISLGHPAMWARDLQGQFYEYCLQMFASAEGKRAVNCTRRGRWSSSWWRCLPPTTAKCPTRAAARAACSCRASGSSGSTRDGSATSASSARRATIRPGASR